MSEIDDAFEKITALVAAFQRDESHYKSPKYTEAQAKTDKDKNYYENKCAALDRQIDRLVYDLYGLTEEEIQIVENSMTS